MSIVCAWGWDEPELSIKLPACDSKLLGYVRHFSVICNSLDVHERACDCGKFSKDLLLIVSKILAGGQLRSFQWNIHGDKWPLFVPELLSTNHGLVALSLDMKSGFPDLETHDLQLPSLRKIHLNGGIRGDEGMGTISALLSAAPNLADVDLDFIVDDQGNADDIAASVYTALCQLSQLQSVGLTGVDLKQVVPFLHLEKLHAMKLRYCSNWDALEVISGICLRDIHIAAKGTDGVLSIKNFLESLSPGLETLILMMDNLGDSMFPELRNHTPMDQSIYILNKASVIKHSRTLYGFAFYLSRGDMFDRYNEDCEATLISACAYITQVRELINSCSLRELSLVVPMDFFYDHGVHEIETIDFKNLRLDDVEILYLVPPTWAEVVSMYCSSERASEEGIINVIIDFLTVAFKHHSNRPHLSHVTLGLLDYVPNYEYSVKWHDYRSEDATHADCKDPFYEGEDDNETDDEGESDDESTNPFRGNYSMEEYAEFGENMEGCEWLSSTRRRRRKFERSIPRRQIHWHPHLEERKVSREMKLGSRSTSYRLYSAVFPQDQGQRMFGDVLPLNLANV
ncbi:hypothetical protein TWF281_000227 [Arthrobotrys megalospora]